MNTFLANETESALGAGLTSPHFPDEPAKLATSLVGPAVTIGGEIFCQQDLFVNGQVTGTMVVPDHKLTIGPQATVKANIKAHNVVIVGNVEGQIEATERIELRGHCRLTGDIKSPRIMIENGAVIKGNVEVTRQTSRGTATVSPQERRLEVAPNLELPH